jgi:hypothetical protein
MLPEPKGERNPPTKSEPYMPRATRTEKTMGAERAKNLENSRYEERSHVLRETPKKKSEPAWERTLSVMSEPRDT